MIKPLFGDIQKITKRNLLKGIPCQRPAKLTVGRCRLHVVANKGPRTEDGLKRLEDSKTKYGHFTKVEREKARARAEQVRIIRRELKELETWFVDHGHLKKNWRKDWA